MVELYFGGGEVPTWRKLLAQEHVPHIGINYLHLQPRLPQEKPWTLAGHFPEDAKLFLVSGASGTEKKGWSIAQHEEFLAQRRPPGLVHRIRPPGAWPGMGLGPTPGVGWSGG